MNVNGIFQSIFLLRSNNSCTHSIDNMISRFNKKIEDDPSNLQYIIKVPVC